MYARRVGWRAFALPGLPVRGRHQGVSKMRGGRLGMLGLVVALLLSIVPAAGAQTSDDSSQGQAIEVQAFNDTAGSVFRNAIDQLAARGITQGCNPPANTRFCPNDPVTRGEMAVFLAARLRAPGCVAIRLLQRRQRNVLPGRGQQPLRSWLDRRLRQSGRYCGNDPIDRGEMAAFLARALQAAGDQLEQVRRRQRLRLPECDQQDRGCRESPRAATRRRTIGSAPTTM